MHLQFQRLHVRPGSTDKVSLTKIICHRHFGNEFARSHTAKITYIYLARSPLLQIFDNETSPKN